MIEALWFALGWVAGVLTTFGLLYFAATRIARSLFVQRPPREVQEAPLVELVKKKHRTMWG